MPAVSAPATGSTCPAAMEGYGQALARYRADIARNPPDQTAGEEEREERAPPEVRIRKAKEAIAKLRDAGGVPLAAALLSLAAAQQQGALYSEALASLSEAETIYATHEPQGAGMALLYRQRGIVLSNMRKREEALAALDKAIALYEQGAAPGTGLLALNLRTRADILRGLNRFTDALETLERVTGIYKGMGQQADRDLIEVLIDKSIILSRLDDRAGQLATAREAVSLSEKSLGLAAPTTARALHNAAVGFRLAENYAAALESLAGAYGIYDSNNALRQAAEAQEETARTFNSMGCYDQAVEMQASAISRYGERYGATHSLIASAKHRLGTYLRSMGRNDLALLRYGEAATMFDDLLGPENVRAAAVLRDKADLLLEMKQTDDAMTAALASVRALEQVNAPEELRRSLGTMSEVLRARGNHEAAILFAKRAVNKQQEIRALNRNLPKELAASFADRYRALYLRLSELLIEAGRLAEAQRVLDLIKSQEVIDFVRGGRPQLLSIDGRTPLTAGERSALSDLDTLMKRPIAAAKELEDLLAKAKKKALAPEEQQRADALKAIYQESYKAFQAEVKALLDGLEAQNAGIQVEVEKLGLDMLGQAQKKLRPFKGRAVLLQIASLEDSVHLFVTTTKGQSHRVSPVSRTDLARLAFDAWNATAHADADAEAHLARLYDILIRPVEGDLRDSGAEVIMLNLEGFLRYIPFAALSSRQRFLIEDYALAMQTPAAATVYERLERDRSRAVGFGVTRAFGDFPGLPAVASELESIFDGSDATGVFAGSPQLDDAFDEDRFAAALEQQPLFVHIASHFKLEPGDESKSFLLLGNGDPLPLDAIRNDARFAFTDVDLLTLSACETAGEVGSDGKEVESFATLAQGSGASSVMATLWPIADASTAALMGDFYRGLLDADLDKAMALRAAQVAMLRGISAGEVPPVRRGVSGTEEAMDAPSLPASRHPYYWSAFILMGNWL